MAWVPHTPPRPSSTNFDQEWEASERQFRRGLELRPNDPNAHHWFGHLLMTLGRVDESLEIARRGYELDPLSPAMNLQWAYALFDARRYDEAVEQLRRSVEMEEDYDRFRRLEASALARLGRAAEGETVWQDVVERLGEGTLSGAGCFLAQLGQTSAAEERVRDLRAIGGDFPLSLARLESCLGNVERSLDALERAQLEGRHPGQLVVDPRFDPLRDEPRYRMVMGEWGLPQDRIFPPTR
jgi:tetratricopeptide (TPR) repeat protein